MILYISFDERTIPARYQTGGLLNSALVQDADPPRLSDKGDVGEVAAYTARVEVITRRSYQVRGSFFVTSRATS